MLSETEHSPFFLSGQQDHPGQRLLISILILILILIVIVIDAPFPKTTHENNLKKSLLFPLTHLLT